MTDDLEHEQHRGELAAHLLGALEPAEERAFAAHLETCADCRRLRAELSGTVDTLAVLREQVSLADPAPRAADPAPRADSGLPGDLLPRLLGAARRERRRHRLVTGLAGTIAAAAVVAAIVLGVTGSKAGTDRTPDLATRPMTEVGDSLVTAAASLDATDWGTRVTLRCRYAAPSGYDAPLTYRLRVIGADGRAYDLGSWSIRPDRELTFTSGVALPRASVRSVEVTTPDGTPLLRLDD